MKEENEKKTEAAVEELEANVREQEAQENLFLQKVLIIGDLHTRRALLANRIGAIKSETIIHRGEDADGKKTPIAEIEKTMRGISKAITDFSPSSVEELEAFKAEIEPRFESVESTLEKIRTPGQDPDA